MIKATCKLKMASKGFRPYTKELMKDFNITFDMIETTYEMYDKKESYEGCVILLFEEIARREELQVKNSEFDWLEEVLV